jgi:hypothetical protein
MSRGYCSRHSRRNWPFVDFDRLDRFALLAAELWERVGDNERDPRLRSGRLPGERP